VGASLSFLQLFAYSMDDLMAAPMLITMGNLGDADFESSTFHPRSA